jgi:hypothetical protein
VDEKVLTSVSPWFTGKAQVTVMKFVMAHACLDESGAFHHFD